VTTGMRMVLLALQDYLWRAHLVRPHFTGRLELDLL
jgi:hypothetical protein